MPIYSPSVVHSLQLDDGYDAIAQLFDVVDVLSDDLDYTDGRVLITVVHEPDPEVNALAGAVAPQLTQVDLVYAIREFPSQRDLDQSNGKFRATDRKFHYKSNSATFAPRLGDRVVFGSERFEIIAVDVQTLGTRYLVWCRAG
jgi:hypothetical protein